MSITPHRRTAGFTISELFVGLMLSSIVMAAVLSSYIYVARAYTRTIGFGLPNEPTLEAQGRRTLAYFTQDVPMASAVSAPSASEVTLSVPHPLVGTKNVTYFYNGTALEVAAYGVTVPANSLVRIDRSTGTLLKLHSSLLTCNIRYYDCSGLPYTGLTEYLMGIKQLTIELTARGGTASNQTMTQEYRLTSPRLILRNKSIPP